MTATQPRSDKPKRRGQAQPPRFLTDPNHRARVLAHLADDHAVERTVGENEGAHVGSSE